MLWTWNSHGPSTDPGWLMQCPMTLLGNARRQENFPANQGTKILLQWYFWADQNSKPIPCREYSP